MTSADQPETRRASATVRGVTAPAVAEIRHRVTDAALGAGLTAQDAEQFTIAVNEAVINAIQHGGGSAEVTVVAGPGRVTVAVRDEGGGIPAHITPHLPTPQTLGGRGLWLVQQLCDDVTIDTSTTGTVVTLSATAGPDVTSGT
ncbi:ATP-binding protein [Micromonospora krabiensis]|uniref:Anti-sigma regulatory factor (Ser/Thr protein kinase) n=1 Tax=Micromonospora krabiensis TaxID=307121 RepID=A0A1C3N2T7_9ACTN|nr:Anti-sigma regulatory factor (Ser/Thr protein kinase) [Micromonospora krabiensis]